MIELETLDLGLTAEGEALNNRSARDRTNSHQRSKPRDGFNPVFIPRSGTAPSGDDADEADGGNGDDMEGTDENQDDPEVEGAGADETSGKDEKKRGSADSSAAAADRTNKRRRIAFKNGSGDSEEPVEAAEEVEQEGATQVYEQGDMTDAQFQTLQNRIKNRPVSSVNGSYEMHTARPLGSMKGHTAFLTFAVCPLRK